jgi:hypothetical protein
MLGVGFPTSLELGSGAEETTFTEARTHDTLFLLSLRLNIQLSSWPCYFTVLSFRASGTTLTGTRTQDTFLQFWPFYVIFLVSRNEHAYFGPNRFVCSRAISQQAGRHAYIHTYIHTCTYIYIYIRTYSFNVIYIYIWIGQAKSEFFSSVCVLSKLPVLFPGFS